MWKTEDGLNEFEGTVIEAKWGTMDSYQNGSALLLLAKVETEDGEVNEFTLPCGSKWEKEDVQGKRAEHPDGKKMFHASGFMGKFVNQCIMETGEESDDGIPGFGIVEEMEKRGKTDTLVASIWEGCKFHFKRTKFVFGTKDGLDEHGEPIKIEIKSERLFPVAFLGFADEAKPDKKASKKTAKPKKAAKVVEEEPEEEEEAEVAEEKPKAKPKKAKKEKAKAPTYPILLQGVADDDPEMAAAIKAAFDEADDHDDFLESAMQIAGVEENADVTELVADEDQIYAELLDLQGE